MSTKALPVGASMTPDEELLKEIRDLRVLAEEKNGAIEARLKTLSDIHEERDKRLAAIEDLLSKQKTRSFGFPDRDVRALKFEPSQKGFDAFLRSKTPVYQRDTELGVLSHEIRGAADDLLISKALWDGMKEVPALKSKVPEIRSTSVFHRFELLRDELAKALDSATSGEGAEWVPTGFSSQFNAMLVSELRVAALFSTIQMPTDPWRWPFEDARPRASVAAESTASANPYDSLSPGAYGSGEPTDNSLFETAKMRALEIASRELTDDSIVAILPWLRSKIIQALAEGREDAIINGDDSGTHQDYDTEQLGATELRRLFKGLRQIAIAKTNTTDISTFTDDLLRGLFKSMGVHGVRPEDTAIIASVSGYWNIVDAAPVITVDQYGPSAFIQAGELGKVHGRSIIISDFMRDDLAATGVNTVGGPNTLSALLTVHKPSFFIGQRPGLGVETERLKVTDQFLILAFDRIAFKNPEAAGTDPVWYGINGD